MWIRGVEDGTSVMWFGRQSVSGSHEEWVSRGCFLSQNAPMYDKFCTMALLFLEQIVLFHKQLLMELSQIELSRTNSLEFSLIGGYNFTN